jgi:hypothetical protein
MLINKENCNTYSNTLQFGCAHKVSCRPLTLCCLGSTTGTPFGIKEKCHRNRLFGFTLSVPFYPCSILIYQLLTLCNYKRSNDIALNRPFLPYACKWQIIWDDTEEMFELLVVVFVKWLYSTHNRDNYVDLKMFSILVLCFFYTMCLGCCFSNGDARKF